MVISKKLERIFGREGLPPAAEYLERTKKTYALLEHEPTQLRPENADGISGGLLYLKPSIPTLVLPDLHGRMDFLLSVFKYRMTEESTVEQELERGSIQILCLGDGFHAEKRAYSRWREALDEFGGGYHSHAAMDEEMRESLGLMEMVMECKLAFPGHFHFLKGNHENILNEEGNGNHPFRKFVLEGPMVLDYMNRFYGSDFLSAYSRFERGLPLLAVGSRFLASHAEPYTLYEEEEVIDARSRPEVILGLTWTDNDAACEGSVRDMLSHYLPREPNAKYLGGHRVISGRYHLRAEGRYVQIHNADRFNAAWVMPDRDFDPEMDTGEIEDSSQPGSGAGITKEKAWPNYRK